MDKNSPWIKNYHNFPFGDDYPTGTMWECFDSSAAESPDFSAISYMGKEYGYSFVKAEILNTAKAFTALGVKKGTRVAICLPNIPQAVFCLYALSRIGGIAAMIHPLSAEKELTVLLKEAECDYCVILDSFGGKFSDAEKTLPHIKYIVTDPAEYLGCFKSYAYKLLKARKYQKDLPKNTVKWRDFICNGRKTELPAVTEANRESVALILFSGGTTGVPKGIALSDYNVNAMATQINIIDRNHMRKGRTLAALPIFHGFGLGVCIHAPLINSGTTVLVPKVNTDEISKLLETVNVFAGVPSLFDAIMQNRYKPSLKGLLGIYSGGDCMSVGTKRRFNEYLKERGCTAQIQEGYGATECFAASCLTPYFDYSEEGIGFPLPDTYFMICAPDSHEELPRNTDGEICLRGPSVMLGYLGHEEETAKVLRTHSDGNVWLHTGDMGYMDDDGRVYFRQRIKRMIVTNGYNVYPARVEEILEAHPKVRQCCVIGAPDERKGQKVKAFVVPQGECNEEELLTELKEHLRKHVAKYALPKEIVFLKELPKTKLNKIDYKALE